MELYLFITMLIALAVVAYAIFELGNASNRILIQNRVYTADRQALEIKLMALCDLNAAQMAGFISPPQQGFPPVEPPSVRYFDEEAEIHHQGRDN